MEEVKKEIQNINSKVDRMYSALMGSDITKDGGMVARLIKIETRQDSVEDEIDRWKETISEELNIIKLRNVKFDTTQKIMWLALGSLLGTVFGYVVLVMFK